MEHYLNRPSTIKLTSRERDVLAYLMLGYKNKAIAGELGLSGHTVQSYLSSIFSKFGVHSRTEAAVYYYKKMTDI